MILDLGLIDYHDCLGIQKGLVARRKLGEVADSLIIAEHYPVFTIGRRGSAANIIATEDEIASSGASVVQADRGGDVTFHGPGQIVAYPIIDLKARLKDLHRYLRDLEDAAVETLAERGIDASGGYPATGVWVDGAKIASVGVAASDWVTYHGIALNVNVDLGFFDMINPCGVKRGRVTSMARLLGAKQDMGVLKRIFTDNLTHKFNMGEREFAGDRYAAVA